jgi:hypothetical protein
VSFLTNVSWQKVVLVLGGFVLLIASIVLFPEAFQRLADTVMTGGRMFADLFTGGTE